MQDCRSRETSCEAKLKETEDAEKNEQMPEGSGRQRGV